MNLTFSDVEQAHPAHLQRPAAGPRQQTLPGGLALTTVLPTPTGWTTVGAATPGDQLLDATGQPCTITSVSDLRDGDCHRMLFDDGSTVTCNAEQRWPTVSGRKAEPGLLTTAWVRGHLRDRRGSLTHRVINAAPLRLPDRDVGVHPYVLGTWLGDGKHTSGEVTKGDDQLFTLIEECGYKVGPNISGRGDRCRASTVYGLRSQLRQHELLGDKHVPEMYFRTSLEQRLALLQGLMDTDGFWNKVRHQAVFTNTSKVLAHAVAELVQTLGAKARVWEVQRRGFGRTVTCYDVTFVPVAFNPFRLTRKAELVRDARTKARRRIIQASEPSVSVPIRALTVESPSGTFLCGDSMIPTCDARALGDDVDVCPPTT